MFVLTSNFLLLTSYLLLAPAGLASLETRLAADPENLTLAAEYRQAIIAAGDYDRAIRLFNGLAARPGAGPHALLNLGLTYIDKIPAVGAIRRISLGNQATAALTRSIEREPSALAYLIRGLVNLHFERGFFHRTPAGVADLETALRLAATPADRGFRTRIYAALGDGYWRLKDRDKARATWRDGQSRFPGDARLEVRLTASDDVITAIIAHDLDAGVRVDTSLRGVLTE